MDPIRQYWIRHIQQTFRELEGVQITEAQAEQYYRAIADKGFYNSHSLPPAGLVALAHYVAIHWEGRSQSADLFALYARSFELGALPAINYLLNYGLDENWQRLIAKLERQRGYQESAIRIGIAVTEDYLLWSTCTGADEALSMAVSRRGYSAYSNGKLSHQERELVQRTLHLAKGVASQPRENSQIQDRIRDEVDGILKYATALMR